MFISVPCVRCTAVCQSKCDSTLKKISDLILHDFDRIIEMFFRKRKSWILNRTGIWKKKEKTSAMAQMKCAHEGHQKARKIIYHPVPGVTHGRKSKCR